MSGHTEIARMLDELGEFGSADLLDEPHDFAQVVVERGSRDGVGLLEACLLTYFKPEAVAKALPLYTKYIHVAAGVDERTFHLMWAKVMRLMDGTSEDPPETALLIRLSAGMVSLSGTPAGQSKPVKIGAEVAMRGRLDIPHETISDHRTGHRDHFGSVRLRPTKQALEARMPAFDHSAAFTAALDELKCWRPGNKGERLITTTKAELYTYLNKRHPGQFGTLDTFSRNYSRDKDQKGRRTSDLKFTIQWMHNRNHD